MCVCEKLCERLCEKQREKLWVVFAVICEDPFNKNLTMFLTPFLTHSFSHSVFTQFLTHSFSHRFSHRFSHTVSHTDYHAGKGGGSKGRQGEEGGGRWEGGEGRDRGWGVFGSRFVGVPLHPPMAPYWAIWTAPGSQIYWVSALRRHVPIVAGMGTSPAPMCARCHSLLAHDGPYINVQYILTCICNCMYDHQKRICFRVR